MIYTATYDIRNFGGGALFAQLVPPSSSLPYGRWAEITPESVYDMNLNPNILAQASALPVSSPDGVVNFVPSLIHYSTDLSVRAMVYAQYHPSSGTTDTGGGGTTTTNNPPPTDTTNIIINTNPNPGILDILAEYKTPIMIGIAAILILGFLRK